MKFGDVLFYVGMFGHITPCVFIRKSGTKSIVIFQHADLTARVDTYRLKTSGEVARTYNKRMGQ